MSRPRLRADLVIVPQVYRGEETYIVKDPETHKYFRLRPIEVVVMQEFDGERTPAQVSDTLVQQGLPFTPTVVEGFARRLAGMGLLERSLAEKSVLQMERLRAERHRRLKRSPYTGSLLRMRWSVGDPDRFFDRWLPRLRFCFTRPFLILSVMMFTAYAVVAAARWPTLFSAIGDLTRLSSYTLGSFLLLYTTALVIIAVHELGHGFTCKYFGGQVHEMGAMLIYFQPAFYCNVNDAWTFPELRARLWVTAAGTWIQLVLAGAAALLWWAATPDTLVSQIALNAVIVGGITTVVANANPLIPLDGYYALSDWLEIPNLRGRAFGYVSWLVRRHVLRLSLPPYPADDRERRVLLVYGALAFAYSASLLLLILAAALGWVSHTVGGMGVVAILAGVWAATHDALREWTQAAATSLREHGAWWRARRRWRNAAMVAAAVAMVGALLPWPIRTRGPALVSAPMEVVLRAPDSALVARVWVREGMRVSPGAPLLTLRSFGLEAQALTLARRADSLAALVQQSRAAGDAGEWERLAAEASAAAAASAAHSARLAAFTVRAPIGGIVATPRVEERVGSAVAAGDTLLRLLSGDSLELRIRLAGAGASLVRPGQAIFVALYDDPAHPVRGTVASVSAATGDTSGALEARFRVPAAAALRVGATGEAKIDLRRSNVWGALWWAVRQRVRSDLLL